MADVAVRPVTVKDVPEIRAVEEKLDERGVSRYELAVLAENELGIGFYASRGFERFDTRTVELAGVETTEYWYRKEL